MDWTTYQDKTKNSPHHRLLEEALRYVKERNAAFDFGAGALRDSKYLLAQGFKQVVALDSTQSEDIPNPRFLFVKDIFEHFAYPADTFDLVTAQYALPFIDRGGERRIFQALKGSLKRGGVITGNFFGVRDEWSGDPTIQFHSKEEVEGFLKGLDILELGEREYEAKTAKGKMKHWHVFEFIARNK